MVLLQSFSVWLNFIHILLLVVNSLIYMYEGSRQVQDKCSLMYFVALSSMLHLCISHGITSGYVVCQVY